MRDIPAAPGNPCNANPPIMNITAITRSLTPIQLSSAFADLEADIVLDLPVRPNRHVELIDRNPLQAGIDFSELALRMCDNGPLSAKEKAYLPWLSVARRALDDMGVWRMDIEATLGNKSDPLHGVCDLLMAGGPKKRGIGETKLIRYGQLGDTLPGRALAQLGSYISLADRRRGGAAMWAVLVFAEIQNRMVKIRGYSSAEELVERTLPLIAA